MTAKILFAALTAVLFSFPAFAGDSDKDRTVATFKALDANRDDKLTQNEVSGDPALAQQFSSLDRNSDGYLTEREFKAHAKSDMNDNTMKDKQRQPY